MTMKIGLAGALLGLLAACGGDGTGGGGFTVGADVAVNPGGSGVTIIGSPGGGPSVPPASDADYSLTLTNYDAMDYALWIQAQDSLGNQSQNFVAVLPAAPAGSFSQVAQDVPVVSGLSYTLLLLDPTGAFFDAFPLGTPNSGDLIPVSLSVVSGSLLPS